MSGWNTSFNFSQKDILSFSSSSQKRVNEDPKRKMDYGLNSDSIVDGVNDPLSLVFPLTASIIRSNFLDDQSQMSVDNDISMRDEASFSDDNFNHQYNHNHFDSDNEIRGDDNNSDYVSSQPLYEEDLEISKMKGKKSIVSTDFSQEQTQPQTSTLDIFESRPEEERFGDIVKQLVYAKKGAGTTVEGNFGFDLVSDFEEICEGRVKALYDYLENRSSLQGDQMANKFSEKRLDFLVSERNTWFLLRVLYQDRDNHPNRSNSEEINLSLESKQGLTQSQILSQLEEKNDEIREDKIVVDWLEKIARGSIQDEGESGDWKNSLITIRDLRKHGAIEDLSSFVTEIDPDVCGRQFKKLNETISGESGLFDRLVWLCIRGGWFEAAKKLCLQRGQPWRAASINGNGFFENDTDIGNPYRSLWKHACLALSNDEGACLSKYERAIYGLLGCNIDAVLPVCSTWDDHLWLNIKIQLELLRDNALKSNPHPFGEDIERSQSVSFRSLRDILSGLRSSSWPAVRAGSIDKYHVIHEMIINDDVVSLIKKLEFWVCDSSCPDTDLKLNKSCSPEFARFSAHLVLFFGNRGFGNDHRNLEEVTRLSVRIISAYIQHLISNSSPKLVALYCMYLPDELAIHTYATFLLGILETNERKEYLSFASEVGLDVENITRRVVEYSLKRDKLPSISYTHPRLTDSTNKKSRASNKLHTNNANNLDISDFPPEDSDKLRSIEWLCFEPSQRLDAIIRSNELARDFIEQGKIAAATKLLGPVQNPVLPYDSILYFINQQQGVSTPLSEQAIRENQGLLALLKAYDAREKWLAHQTEKLTPPSLPLSQKPSEQIKYDTDLKNYNEKMRGWEEVNKKLVSEFKKLVYQVVCFKSGWLLDVTDTGDSAIRREKADKLRRLVIPSLLMLLHDVLYTSAYYKSSLGISKRIADEHYGLYKLFTPKELEKFMSLFKDSSLALLQQQEKRGCVILDPFGALNK